MSKHETQGESRYALKRRSGRMMYGPAPRIPKVPDFQIGRQFVFCRCGNVFNKCCGAPGRE